MDQNVLIQARSLVERAQARGQSGILDDPAAVELLNRALGGRVPPWYAELITAVPLCGLEMGWQSREPSPGDDGVSWLEWLDVVSTRQECLDLYPGLVILSHGYLCVGGCLHGSGDQYFMPTGEGEDPPLYQIDHESGDDAGQILSHGRYLVASSLSEFFRLAKIR